MDALEIQLLNKRMEAAVNEPDRDKKKEMIDDIKESPAFKHLGECIQRLAKVFTQLAENVVRIIKPILMIHSSYRKIQRKTFYKKKRSQRKNWSKWKKRK